VDPFVGFNLAMGLLAGAGIVYLLYLERVVVRHRRFLLVVTAGVLMFTIAGDAVELVAPAWVHVVHGIAGLLVVAGLYEPIHRNLRPGGSLNMLVNEPASVRLPPGWMAPMDDDILELFHSADLVLTPAIIAYNLDYSREEVNRRLSELQGHDIVERVERGKYRITRRGEQYILGGLGGHAVDVETDSGESQADGSTVH